MNLWRCPKCGDENLQPDCVTAIAHHCTPRSPRSTELHKIDRQPTDDNQGQSTLKRKQKQ